MAPEPWKTLSSRVVYQNNWTTVREDLAELPNGKSTIYGVVQCPEAVGVLPFVDDEHVLMVRQYRYVFGENHRWEMPTGGVKSGETLQQAVRRELREEAGYDPAHLEHIHTYFTSKMIVHEVAHLFIGHQLVPAVEPADETEFLEIACFPFAEVLQMVLDSEIRDSMTVIAVLVADRLRRQPNDQ